MTTPRQPAQVLILRDAAIRALKAEQPVTERVIEANGSAKAKSGA